VLTAAGVVACGSGSEPDVGADEAARLATPTASASAGPSVRASVPVRGGDLPGADGVVPPRRLSIPDIGVTATVDAVGVNDATGEFDVPPSVYRVGWYRYGPGLEARAGSVVIAGHVDGAGQGPGAFFRLRELDRGDRITVSGADGRAVRWRVIAREEYTKTQIPLERYFARDGALRLTLITCGGPFDRATRRYRDNIVVTAVPA
jgi:hypothetical protein